MLRFLHASDGKGLQVEKFAAGPCSETVLEVIDRFWAGGRVAEEAGHGPAQSLEEAAWIFFSGLGFDVSEIERGDIGAGGALVTRSVERLYHDRLGTPIVTQRQASDDFGLRLVSVDSAGANGRFLDRSQVDGDGSDIVFTGIVDSIFDEQRVFVKDMDLGGIDLVSLAQDGGPTYRTSTIPLAISRDGRYVAYGSASEDVVPDGVRGEKQFYRFDRLTRTTARITTTISGGPLFDVPGVYGLTMSGDGARVVFEGNTSDLVLSPTGNGLRHLYLWDEGVISAVDARPDGAFPAGNSGEADLSSDGRWVVFVFDGTDLVPGVTT
ncbi:MAG: hypothetical protein KDA28_09490, partial [Phycisphaerales bacterium]|nr:hypothetical protein [Phycisphaerales bacterium]